MEAAVDERRSGLNLEHAACLTLAVVGLLLLSTIVGLKVWEFAQENHDDQAPDVTVNVAAPAPQLGGDTVMAVGPGGSGGAGAVEEAKGFYAGRPLFKVPPSSPCRAKAGRC